MYFRASFLLIRELCDVSSAALETGESCRAQQTEAVMSCLPGHCRAEQDDWHIYSIPAQGHENGLMGLTELPPAQYFGPNVGQGVDVCKTDRQQYFSKNALPQV